MTDDPSSGDERRIKAAELYAAARKLEAQRDYQAAIKAYEESLQLHDDPAVKTAYFKLLATIGPQ